MNGLRIVVTCVAAGLLAAPVVAGYEEHWDAGDSRNWQYWALAGTPPTEQGLPMWVSLGGGHIGGYVRTPMDVLAPEHADNALWPAFTVEWDRDASQNLDLNVDPIVQISMKALPRADLQGATLGFFIGYWSTDDDWAFYRHDTPVAVGDDWVRTTIDVRTGGWLPIAKGTAPTQGPSDIYDNPQQYGFVLVDWAAQPTGQLGFDEFANIPEPATVAVLALGATALLSRRRVRGTQGESEL